MKDLHSYIPELSFLQDKHQAPSRLFCEECAVLDAANGYRVLASRTKGLADSSSFFNCYEVFSSELDFLERALTCHSRVLIRGKDHPILIFADLLPYTHALIAIVPQVKASALVRAISLIGQNKVMLSPQIQAERSSAEENTAEACEQAAELFFYMDHILTPSAEIGMWTRTLLIANFAGCKLDRISLPTQTIALSHANEARLALFLLCCFFTLRHTNGTKFAIGNTPISADEPYRYLTGTLHCTEYSTNADRPPIDARFPFLSLSAFECFSARVSNEKLVLEARLPQASNTASLLHSEPTVFCYLCLELTDTVPQ